MEDNTGIDVPATREEMVGAIKRYRKATLNLGEMKERGKEYLEQVKAEIEQDLEGARAELDASKESLRILLKQSGENNYRVPGLGTAYFVRGRRTRVVDEDAVVAALSSMGRYSPDFWDTTINKRNVKEAAEKVLKEEGELLEGMESEEVETLAVRL